MTEDAFLAAIRERPDDAATRLVFADWFEERGETARAAELRHGCRFRRPITVAETAHLPRIATAREQARAADVLLVAAGAPFATDVAHLDPLKVARNFPRDARGRLATGVRVLLTPIPNSAPQLRRREPWLVASGPDRRSSPQRITVHTDDLTGENHRHNWTHLRGYWDRRHPPPTWDDGLIARCTALQDQGRFEEALRLCGVHYAPEITRILNAELVQLQGSLSFGAGPIDERPPRRLRQALWEAAPRFAEALRLEQARLDRWTAARAGRSHKNANARLFTLLGIHPNHKPMVMLTAGEGGTPTLRIVFGRGITVIPETHWKRPVEYDLQRLTPVAASAGAPASSDRRRRTPTPPP